LLAAQDKYAQAPHGRLLAPRLGRRRRLDSPIRAVRIRIFWRGTRWLEVTHQMPAACKTAESSQQLRFAVPRKAFHQLRDGHVAGFLYGAEDYALDVGVGQVTPTLYHGRRAMHIRETYEWDRHRGRSKRRRRSCRRNIGDGDRGKRERRQR